jgi:hypothetical protein
VATVGVCVAQSDRGWPDRLTSPLPWVVNEVIIGAPRPRGLDATPARCGGSQLGQSAAPSQVSLFATRRWPTAMATD